MSREKLRASGRHQIQIKLVSEVLRLANRLHRAPHGLLKVKHDMIEGFNHLLNGDLAACALCQRNGRAQPDALANACAARGASPAAGRRKAGNQRVDAACEHLLRLIERGPGGESDPGVVVSFVEIPGDGLFAGVAVSRGGSGNPFSAAERALLGVMHVELRWIYEIDLPLASPQAAGLTARQRETFLYLLTGARESEIAGRMELGQNTVHHHVKRIYDRFNVSSRRELLDRFPRRANWHGQRRQYSD